MKAKVVEKYLRKIQEEWGKDDSEFMVEVNTTDKRVTVYDPVHDEWEVDHEDNLLIIQTDTGTRFIDCDFITSIHI